MKESPILFSGEMVRAIIEGRKTQTRRVLKKQPIDILPMNVPNEWVTLETRKPSHGSVIGCRFGVPGDRLWVRETFALERYEDEPATPKDGRPIRHQEFRSEWASDYWLYPHYCTDPAPDLCYEDDPNDDGEPKCKWKPSIHMPRWASRITLEIVSVRVERVKSITPADAFAEGVRSTYLHQPPDWLDVDRFKELWEKINAKRGYGWQANPWVWVIEFKRV